MASLMIGMDFYDTEVYVGLWAEDERCAKTFYVDKLSDTDSPECIPLFVCPDGNGRFYAGHEGIEYSIQQRCNGVSMLYGKGVKERVNVNGVDYDVTDLIAGFLFEILYAIKKHFGGASVARLCLTGSRMNKEDEGRLRKALEKLDYSPEQAVIINHANAFAKYILHLEESKRKDRAAAIDLDKNGSCVYSFVPCDNRSGAPNHICFNDVSELVQGGLENVKEPEEKMKLFETVVNTTLARNVPLRKLYVTGKSIEDERIKGVLRKFASENFRIFSGQNLYASGACYMAVDESAGDRTIYDGEVFHSISLEGYKDALIDAVLLIPAGTKLEKAKARVDVILDGTKELVFHVTDLRNGNRKVYTFSPDDLQLRDNRTQRMEITVMFLDVETLVIKVRDIGFGSLYPATYRIWEQVLSL